MAAPDGHRHVQVDSRGRVTLSGLVDPGARFLAHVTADGTVILEPAVLLRATTIDYMARLAAPCDRCACPRADHTGDDHTGPCTNTTRPDDPCQCDHYRPQPPYTPTSPR